MSKDPYFFPFEIVKTADLVPGENYYIKLDDKVIKDFSNKRRSLPVSHLKGTFSHLHNTTEGLRKIEYAVFKNIKILNKEYKAGLCSQMLVKHSNGSLASDDCDTYSDRTRTINTHREVYFSSGKWMFGIPTEQKLVANKMITTLKPELDDDTTSIINKFRGTAKGIRKRSKKNRKSRTNSKRKHKIYKNRKTYKRY